MTCKKHEFTYWFCPYWDYNKQVMIDTCCNCGKVKYQKIKYVGRDKNDKRILVKI